MKRKKLSQLQPMILHDVASLLGQFEQARLGANDFLNLGHIGVSPGCRG
ncbi:MAG: hypothetical protein AB7U61_07475 [Methylocystis sp.]